MNTIAAVSAVTFSPRFSVNSINPIGFFIISSSIHWDIMGFRKIGSY
jgi:hypothetical protein